MSLSNEITQSIDTVEHEALLEAVKTVNLLEKKASLFFADHGISEAQYNILIVLKLEARPLTQVEIGERLVISRAGITAVLDKLENKGYVVRKKVVSDRRVFHVEMTKQGKKIVDKVEPLYLEEVHELMSCFNKKECKQLSEFMIRLRKKV